jgi:hypothetical protein
MPLSTKAGPHRNDSCTSDRSQNGMIPGPSAVFVATLDGGREFSGDVRAAPACCRPAGRPASRRTPDAKPAPGGPPGWWPQLHRCATTTCHACVPANQGQSRDRPTTRATLMRATQLGAWRDSVFGALSIPSLRAYYCVSLLTRAPRMTLHRALGIRGSRARDRLPHRALTATAWTAIRIRPRTVTKLTTNPESDRIR